MDGVYKPICSNCKHFEPVQDDIGLCLRYPPRAEPTRTWGMYPAISLGDRCGEFKDKWGNVRKEMGDP